MKINKNSYKSKNSTHLYQLFYSNFLTFNVFCQKRAENLGLQPSLWRVYRKVHGVKMLISLSLKITADLLSYVGPLALDPIIQYVTRIEDSDEVCRTYLLHNNFGTFKIMLMYCHSYSECSKQH